MKIKKFLPLLIWLGLFAAFLALPFHAFGQNSPIQNLVVQDNSGTNLTGISLMNGSSPVTVLGIGTNLTLTGGTLNATGGTGSVANPTATIGLTAVNGTATSAIRSDGAPALSQSITPTWTGLHTFTNPLNTFGVAGTGNATYQINIIGPSGGLGGGWVQITNNTTGTARFGTGGQLSNGVTNSPASTDSMWVNQTTAGKSWMINNGIGTFSTSPAGNVSWVPILATPTATLAGFNPGSVAGNPSSLSNGDIWYNSSGNVLNARINGATVSLGSGGGGSGTVTSVTFTGDGIVDSATPSTPVTTSGSVVATPINQSANTVLAGPTTGSAAAPSFRALVPADLPLGSSSAFGAVKVDGTTITSSGGVITAVSGGAGTVTSVSVGNLSPLFTTSVATATTTPAITFSLSTAAAHTVLGNATGSTAAPAYNTFSAALDDAISSTQGTIMYRNATGWVGLAPGTATNVLTTGGAGANPSWAAAGGGSVANPTATIGLTAVNGTATSAIRSDGAPALSQAIVPTWTGTHTFNVGPFMNNTSGNYTHINGVTTTSQSFGLEVAAGTNGNDVALLVTSQTGGPGVMLRVLGNGEIDLTKTIAATTGAQTINKVSGQVQFAAAATSLVVTDSLCATTSIINCTLGTNDATAVFGNVVAGAGSFTINLKTAPTGTTLCNFVLTN